MVLVGELRGWYKKIKNEEEVEGWSMKKKLCLTRGLSEF